MIIILNMEHFFTTYLRTKLLYQHRLKGLKTYDHVKVYLYELNKLRVDGKVLYRLREEGQISYDNDGNFKVMTDGPIDMSLLDLTKRYTRESGIERWYHAYMKNVLRSVTIDEDISLLPVYFRSFLQLQHSTSIDAFFKVDGFSGRVHTPIVNLKGEFRKSLRIKGIKLCSLDVKQMQPLILGKILKEKVGENPFSKAISEGKDVYIVLMDQNKTIKDRGEAKVFLYRLIFGHPMTDIGTVFQGDTKWVTWINDYKSNTENKNPHKRDKHTNLAWLLQTEEVRVMTYIWKELAQRGIDFLTIHDDVLVKKYDKDEVYSIMVRELGKHFEKFDLSVSCS